MLRRCIKLDEIENIVDDLQKKSEDLLNNAERMAKIIAEEVR